MADIIYSTDLNPSTKLRAITLLELAHPENGHVTLEWSELSDLWGCALGTVRRQLGAIHQAGLIHYSSNGDGIVYITFKHLSRAHARKSAKNSRESARGRAESVLPEATPEPQPEDEARAHARKSAKNSRENARGRAESVLSEANPSHVGASAGLDGWMDRSSDTNEIPSIPPTPQTAETAEPPPSQQQTIEQAICLALLLRIRMRADKARIFAATLPLRTVREAVGAWWMNRKETGGKYDNHPGIVVHWLENHSSPVWPVPPGSWQRDPLYLQFRTRAERAEDDAPADGGDWQPPPSAPRRQAPAPEPGTPAAIWVQLQSDFALHQQAGSVDNLIQDSWVVAYADGAFTVGVADANRLDWAEKKLRPQIKRKLAIIMGRPVVDVTFVVQNRPENDT